MSEPEVEFEFTAEGVVEGFGEDPFLGPLLAQAEVSPEEFAGYLNEIFDQEDRQAIAAMCDDHEVGLSVGGKASFLEVNSFEDWKEKSGFEGDQSGE